MLATVCCVRLQFARSRRRWHRHTRWSPCEHHRHCCTFRVQNFFFSFRHHSTTPMVIKCHFGSARKFSVKGHRSKHQCSVVSAVLGRSRCVKMGSDDGVKRGKGIFFLSPTFEDVGCYRTRRPRWSRILDHR